MARGKTIESLLADAEQIERVWTANPSFSLGDITLAQFQTKITELRAARGKAEALRTQLTAAVNDANERSDDLAALVTRARSGFRAFYGPDSTQYEQAGGTRASDRKRPARKPRTGTPQ
jgi:hypothetical protein